jgi:hypothetical protein
VKERQMKKQKAGKSKAPITKVMPGESDGGELFGFLANKVKIIGDIESPIFLSLKRRKISKQAALARPKR